MLLPIPQPACRPCYAHVGASLSGDVPYGCPCTGSGVCRFGGTEEWSTEGCQGELASL
jgi:hypothetical protein